jgi:hypothetical protein
MLDEDVEVAEPTEEPEGPPEGRKRTNEERHRLAAVYFHAITIAVFVILFLAAVVGNWQRSQNVDPLFAYDMVLRTMHFGGTYYQNAINDWGPGEPYLYSVAAHLLSRDAFWYGISFYIACFGAILAFAAARTAKFFGANRDVALMVAIVVFFHFTLSNSDYAGVFYVRNLTTALLAIAWIVMLWDRAWSTKRGALIAAIAAGASLGIAVQNLVPTAFAAIPISLTILAMARQRRPKEETTRIDVAFIGAGTVAFLSAPVWYLLRGSFTEFFEGWWSYAHNMSIGPGRSLGGQFALGWDQFYAYYTDRPLAAIAIIAFVAMVFIDWKQASRREKYVYLGLTGWFAMAWLELILSQRYSSQYFAVSSVPVAFMVAALVGRGFRAIVAARGKISWTYAWPLIALVLAITLSGATHFTQSVQDLSSFTTVKAHAAERAKNVGGDIKSSRAVLDLVSKPWDPVLVWTNDPWPYLDVQRISATRFIWKSFLTGEIYLGRTSDSYVLPHSWQWFADDLKQSNPAAYFKSNGGEIPPDSPFANVVRDQFTVVYPGAPSPISFRNDLAQQYLSPSADAQWNAPHPPSRAGTGWKNEAGKAQYREAGGRDVDLLPISDQSCFVLTGKVDSDGPPGGLTFYFNNNAHQTTPRVNLTFDGDHVSSGNDNATINSIPTGLSGSGQTPTDFALFVNRRSAAMVVNGQIRAAVQIPPSVNVQLRSQRGILNVTDMKVGPSPSASGC